MFIKKYLKIFLLLGGAFLLSIFFIKNIFLANSPRFNPFFAQNLQAKVSSFFSKTTSFFAFKNRQPSAVSTKASDQNPTSFTFNSPPSDVKDALNTSLSKISQGVYAGEKNNIKVYEVRTNEIEYLEYTFNVNGKEIKIKVPKDQQPPSQEVVEALYK